MDLTADPRSSSTATHPLVYVACELRVPFSPRLSAQASVERMVELLTDMPVLREDGPQVTALTDGGLDFSPAKVWRLADRAATRSLVLSPTSLRYETTRYPGFDAFRTNFERILETVEDVCGPVGYDRLGLRYVNEVRPTGPYSTFGHWSRYVASQYIEALAGAEVAVQSAFDSNDGAPADIARNGDVYEPRTVGPPAAEPAAVRTSSAVVAGDLDSSDDSSDDAVCRLQAAETVLKFSLPYNGGMVLRLGNLDGPGVVGNAPLRRYQLPEPGPFFLIDFDGFWPNEPDDIRPFEKTSILSVLHQVHAAVKTTFGWATSPTYRQESGVVNQ